MHTLRLLRLVNIWRCASRQLVVFTRAATTSTGPAIRGGRPTPAAAAAAVFHRLGSGSLSRANYSPSRPSGPASRSRQPAALELRGWCHARLSICLRSSGARQLRCLISLVSFILVCITNGHHPNDRRSHQLYNHTHESRYKNMSRQD